jgi:hypothetical protein
LVLVLGGIQLSVRDMTNCGFWEKFETFRLVAFGENFG